MTQHIVKVKNEKKKKRKKERKKERRKERIKWKREKGN